MIVVIVAGVLLACGRLGTMPKQVDDRPGPDLPAGRLSAADLERVEFDVVTRGYSPMQVNALLDRLAVQLRQGVSGARHGLGTGDAPDQKSQPEPKESTPIE